MTGQDEAAKAAVTIGCQLAGYQLEERIGQGNLGVVFRARDQRLGRDVALKVLATDAAADPEFRAHFQRVARSVAAIDHPHIVPVYDAGEADGYLYIAMRYLPGGTVQSLLHERGAVPPDQAWKIISQAASALDAAHRHNLIHSSLKPSNLLFDHRGDVYLSDFGLDRIARADDRADQYLLACVAFELLTGIAPFGRQPTLADAHLSGKVPSVHALRADVPNAVDQVLVRALAHNPADRYPTSTEFATDFGRALGLDEAEGGPAMESWPSAETSWAGRETASGPTQPYGGPGQPTYPGTGSIPGSWIPQYGGGSYPGGTQGGHQPVQSWGPPGRVRRSRRTVKTAGPDDPVSRAVREAVRPGLLAFNPPRQMNQGRPERVEVGVARSAALREELTAGLRGRGVAETLPVPTSPAMGVELRGSSFEIDALSPAEQLIVPIARWEFDVTPVRAGSQTLTLCVSLRVDSPFAVGGRIAVPVLERQIQIQVNFGYGIRRFTANNWQWVAGTVIGLGGGIAAWIELVH